MLVASCRSRLDAVGASVAGASARPTLVLEWTALALFRGSWRAGWGESLTSGSEGGPEKPTDRTVTGLWPDPYCRPMAELGRHGR
jgi:hypothetical protein